MDLEGDMEKQEVIEGGSVDHKSKMGHEEGEKPKEAEMGMDGDVPQEGSDEIQSLKGKVVRVESEETQDYVRETLAISQEEAEETGFVPSALGEPRRAIQCDNRCSEKAVRYWQIASMVVEEGGEAHTINLCQQCCNER